MNLYGYVGGRPTRFVDPLGFDELVPVTEIDWGISVGLPAAGAGAGASRPFPTGALAKPNLCGAFLFTSYKNPIGGNPGWRIDFDPNGGGTPCDPPCKNWKLVQVIERDRGGAGNTDPHFDVKRPNVKAKGGNFGWRPKDDVSNRRRPGYLESGCCADLRKNPQHRNKLKNPPNGGPMPIVDAPNMSAYRITICAVCTDGGQEISFGCVSYKRKKGRYLLPDGTPFKARTPYPSIVEDKNWDEAVESWINGDVKDHGSCEYYKSQRPWER